MRIRTVWLVGALASLAVAGVGMAQDPLKVAPDTNKLALENGKVRVIDIHVPAGGHVAMHSHPAGYVLIALTDCSIKFTLHDGKTSEATVHAGDISWHEAVTHAAQNIGANECHVIDVEPRSHAMHH